MKSASFDSNPKTDSGFVRASIRATLVIILILGMLGCKQQPEGRTYDADGLSCDDQKEFAVLRANAELERIPKATTDLSTYACGIGIAVTVLTLGADVGAGAALGCGAAVLVATADATQNAESQRYSVLKAHYEMLSMRCQAEMKAELQAELQAER